MRSTAGTNMPTQKKNMPTNLRNQEIRKARMNKGSFPAILSKASPIFMVLPDSPALAITMGRATHTPRTTKTRIHMTQLNTFITRKAATK